MSRLGRSTCSWSACVLLIAATICGTVRIDAAHGNDDVVSKFEQLSHTEQLQYLKSAIETFREKARNISAKEVQETKNVSFDPEIRKVGDKVLMEGGRREFVLRRVGDSYWMSADSDSDTLLPTQSYDAAQALTRQYAVPKKPRDLAEIAGLIAEVRGTMPKHCFLYQYLGDDSVSDGHLDNPGRWFLKNLDHGKVKIVDRAAARVEVSFPYPDLGGADTGTFNTTFDLTRDAALIGFTVDRRTERPDRKPEDYRYQLELTELRQFGDVWIPTKARKLAWNSSTPDQITEHTIRISDIEIGKLTADDLPLKFPVGTKVQDLFSG